MIFDVLKNWCILGNISEYYFIRTYDLHLTEVDGDLLKSALKESNAKHIANITLLLLQ